MYTCPVKRCVMGTDLREPLCKGHRGLVPVGLLNYIYRTWDDGKGAQDPRRWEAIKRAAAAAEQAESA